MSVIMGRMEPVMRHTGRTRLGSIEKFCHRTALKLRLLPPWMRAGLVVCEKNSYSALAQRAEAMMRYEMRIISVVKNAVKNFPCKIMYLKKSGRQEIFSQ